MESQVATAPHSYARTGLFLINVGLIVIAYTVINLLAVQDSTQVVANPSTNSLLLTAILVLVSGMGWFMWLTRRLD